MQYPLTALQSTAKMIAKLALLAATCHALAPNAVTSVIREKLAEVEEPAALDLAAKYEAVDLPSSRTTFVRTNAKSAAPALVLLHGFDSSLFEYRRLLPQLEAQGVEAYALDLVGWGLTSPKQGVSIEAKRQQIEEFVRDVVKGPCVLAGASLGAAVVVDALRNGQVENVEKVALIGPQCFIDGAPPVRSRCPCTRGVDRVDVVERSALPRRHRRDASTLRRCRSGARAWASASYGAGRCGPSRTSSRTRTKG